ncbi:MAG: CDP-alcohol phosphatidyltransferase family protein, partial [Planctomycetota bacterium]
MPVAWWHALPNAITSVRFVLALGCLFALGRAGALEGPERATFGAWGIDVFIVAALTDILDGYLARRWN